MGTKTVPATNTAREITPEAPPKPNDSTLKEGESMQTATATNQEAQVDSLVEDAVKKINDIIVSFQQNQLKVGEYVLDKFFNGNIEEVCKHNPKKEDSFAKICRHPDLKVNYRTLRSWVHAAGIYRELGDLKPNHIGMSHFVELCSVKDKDKRLYLAMEAEEGKWSVSDLRKKIMEAKTADANATEGDEADKTVIEGRLTVERAIKVKSTLAADEEKAMKFVKDTTKLREAFPDSKVVVSMKEIAKRMAEIEREKRVFKELYDSLQGLVNEDTKLVEVLV